MVVGERRDSLVILACAQSVGCDDSHHCFTHPGIEIARCLCLLERLPVMQEAVGLAVCEKPPDSDGGPRIKMWTGMEPLNSPPSARQRAYRLS